ncbi:MAG: PilT/PilU family type 4a pilus ATPase [Vicinamibacteria bacterium]|nr:PilT/PilU family type 4a pilus ATPase [Vicinamibacteria bacterium]
MAELDRIVEELNATTAAREKRVADRLAGDDHRLVSLLRETVILGASDLLLVSGLPPTARVRGDLMRLKGAELDSLEIEEIVFPELPVHAVKAYRDGRSADASLRLPGLGRFRVNLHRERGRAAAAIRALPTKPPALRALNLPQEMDRISRIARGLVLIAGATGSGKTTTLAAIVNEINQRDARHIVTIEDPIEYEHPHARCVVEQVEVGIDAPDFPTALRSSMRQAPDVIVVGEMRDAETMRTALAAAETGHLVLSTLHAGDTPSCVARIADSFPAERQPMIRQEIAMGLAAVITQVLLPKQGGGRIPATEILMVGYGARQLIRRNQLQNLHQEITITRPYGSMTFEECLSRLVKAGQVTTQDAMTAAVHPEDLEALLRTLP